MTSIEYPADVIRELNDLRTQSHHAVTELFKLEREMVEAVSDADRIEALAMLEAEGAVAIKEAFATLKSLDARKAAEMARIKVNYAKGRIRQLSESINAVQTAGKMIELHFKTAGVESR